MKNFNTSKLFLYYIKNMKVTLIDTDIAESIHLIHVNQFVTVHYVLLHQSPNYWISTVIPFIRWKKSFKKLEKKFIIQLLTISLLETKLVIIKDL